MFQKGRTPNNYAEWRQFRVEISHMRPILGQKLKLFKVLTYGRLEQCLVALP